MHTSLGDERHHSLAVEVLKGRSNRCYNAWADPQLTRSTDVQAELKEGNEHRLHALMEWTSSSSGVIWCLWILTVRSLLNDSRVSRGERHRGKYCQLSTSYRQFLSCLRFKSAIKLLFLYKSSRTASTLCQCPTSPRGQASQSSEPDPGRDEKDAAASPCSRCQHSEDCAYSLPSDWIPNTEPVCSCAGQLLGREAFWVLQGVEAHKCRSLDEDRAVVSAVFPSDTWLSGVGIRPQSFCLLRSRFKGLSVPYLLLIFFLNISVFFGGGF